MKEVFAPHLVSALREAERFMAYFAGETEGEFAGPGTPKSCLADIREALAMSELSAEQLEEYGHGMCRLAAEMTSGAS